MGLDDLLKEIEAKDPVLAKKLASEIDTRRLEAIRNLAGCVGHAFNNILAAVIGYAGLLSESPQSEEDKDSVKNILLSGARGLGWSGDHVLRSKDFEERIAWICTV